MESLNPSSSGSAETPPIFSKMIQLPVIRDGSTESVDQFEFTMSSASGTGFGASAPGQAMAEAVEQGASASNSINTSNSVTVKLPSYNRRNRIYLDMGYEGESDIDTDMDSPYEDRFKNIHDGSTEEDSDSDPIPGLGSGTHHDQFDSDLVSDKDINMPNVHDGPTEDDDSDLDHERSSPIASRVSINAQVIDPNSDVEVEQVEPEQRQLETSQIMEIDCGNFGSNEFPQTGPSSLAQAKPQNANKTTEQTDTPEILAAIPTIPSPLPVPTIQDHILELQAQSPQPNVSQNEVITNTNHEEGRLVTNPENQQEPTLPNSMLNFPVSQVQELPVDINVEEILPIVIEKPIGGPISHSKENSHSVEAEKDLGLTQEPSSELVIEFEESGPSSGIPIQHPQNNYAFPIEFFQMVEEEITTSLQTQHPQSPNSIPEEPEQPTSTDSFEDEVNREPLIVEEIDIDDEVGILAQEVKINSEDYRGQEKIGCVSMRPESGNSNPIPADVVIIQEASTTDFSPPSPLRSPAPSISQQIESEGNLDPENVDSDIEIVEDPPPEPVKTATFRANFFILDLINEQKPKADTIIRLKDGVIGAHKLVLASCSPFLAELLKEQDESTPTLILPDIRKSVMQKVLHLMYHGFLLYPSDDGDDSQRIQIQDAMNIIRVVSPNGFTVQPVAPEAIEDYKRRFLQKEKAQNPISKLKLTPTPRPAPVPAAPVAAPTTPLAGPSRSTAIYPIPIARPISLVPRPNRRLVLVKKSIPIQSPPKEIPITIVSSEFYSIYSKASNPDVSIVKCNLCKRSFESKIMNFLHSAINNHFDIIHKDMVTATLKHKEITSLLSCDICNKEFTNIRETDSCLQSHDHVRCWKCMGSFPSESIRDHYLASHVDPQSHRDLVNTFVRCNWCPKLINIRNSTEAVGIHGEFHIKQNKKSPITFSSTNIKVSLSSSSDESELGESESDDSEAQESQSHSDSESDQSSSSSSFVVNDSDSSGLENDKEYVPPSEQRSRSTVVEKIKNRRKRRGRRWTSSRPTPTKLETQVPGTSTSDKSNHSQEKSPEKGSAPTSTLRRSPATAPATTTTTSRSISAKKRKWAIVITRKSPISSPKQAQLIEDEDTENDKRKRLRSTLDRNAKHIVKPTIHGTRQSPRIIGTNK